MPVKKGRTIGLYADSGAGKTTQAGEYAKYIRRTTGKNSILRTSDLGGYNSINHLVRAGVVAPDELDDQNPWIWIDDGVSGRDLDPKTTGLVIFDSGTSMSEALLSAAHKSPFQVGQQRTQSFSVAKGDRNLNVTINNEAHYGVVQGFMRDAIWKSTAITRKGIDVLWTFGVYRSEEQDRTPILGPKLAGKALTPDVPKWFNYFWRLESIPVEDSQPRHVLYTAEYPELAGLGHSFGNSRIPLGVDIVIPPVIEPASITTVLELLDKAEQEAYDKLIAEINN